jgi:hypothetical protein
MAVLTTSSIASRPALGLLSVANTYTAPTAARSDPNATLTKKTPVYTTLSHPDARTESSAFMTETARVSKHEHLRRRAQWQPKNPSGRNPIQEHPIPLRVYFIPDGRYVPPSSIIHGQKRQNGFFLHPVLVISVDPNQGIVHFYALTSNPPDAIRDLGMYLRFGTTTEDEGEDVLRLAEDSDRMPQVTFANMEQQFRVEYQYLDYWRGNVAIDPNEWAKIERKINLLEAEQNRYIYKPIQRDMKDVEPGTILMLPNPASASTLGAPILVIDVAYPYFRYLRVKEITKSEITTGKFTEGGITQEEVAKDTMEAAEKSKAVRALCLRMCRSRDPADEPVLLFAPDSREMRNASYLECSRKERWVHCDNLKTWSYPHVRISWRSMNWLKEYLAKLPEPQKSAPAAPPPVAIRRPLAYPQHGRMLQPQPPPMLHSHIYPRQVNNMYLQYGNRQPPAQHNTGGQYEQQAAMNGYRPPTYHGNGPYMPQTTRPTPLHPAIWPYPQSLPTQQEMSITSPTAYPAGPGPISWPGFFTNTWRTANATGPGPASAPGYYTNTGRTAYATRSGQTPPPDYYTQNGRTEYSTSSSSAPSSPYYTESSSSGPRDANVKEV